MKFSRNTKLPNPGEIVISPLEADTEYREIAAGIAALEARMAIAERRRATAQAITRAQRRDARTADVLQPVRNVLDRAQALLAGGRVSAIDPTRELIAADEEVRICLEAIDHERARLQERRGELSLALAEKFKPMNRAALRAAVAAVEDLFAALETAREINARIQAAGFSPPSWILPMGAPEGALILGNPANMGTEASRFARFVEGLD